MGIYIILIYDVPLVCINIYWYKDWFLVISAIGKLLVLQLALKQWVGWEFNWMKILGGGMKFEKRI